MEQASDELGSRPVPGSGRTEWGNRRHGPQAESAHGPQGPCLEEEEVTQEGRLGV